MYEKHALIFIQRKQKSEIKTKLLSQCWLKAIRGLVPFTNENEKTLLAKFNQNLPFYQSKKKRGNQT